ncbi:peptidoglycan recognition protein family protein [Brevibacterium album]|uniref:peptidoglycan recognition protein family protein n=1 Tax=Brevibacterium album TaxID=417948 RepID=UPI00042551BA|nr:N-acetylmuramoyl-L-alanine amidase [Brevibacterium album]
MARLTGLALVARRTGYPVIEVAGWKSRGRAMNSPKSVVVHHTASGKGRNAPSLGVVKNGRPGLPGPLCHYLLARDGTIYVVASGRANHAGKVNATRYSNSNSIGIEAENNGVGEAWSAKQMDAYAKLCRELCDHYKIPITHVRGHKEVCSPRGRKIDPTFNMGSFRNMVKARKGTGAGGGGSSSSSGRYESPTAKHTIGSRIMRLYSGGTDVRWLQEQLKSLGYDLGKGGVDGFYGPTVEKHVRHYQESRGLGVDGRAGKETIGALQARKPAVKKPPKPRPTAPAFPLKKGWYFGPKSGPTRSVSGYYSHRADLRRWQERMIQRGWNLGPGGADGLYGPATARVAKAFQKEKGLGVDSLIGKDTWDAAWTEPVT